MSKAIVIRTNEEPEVVEFFDAFETYEKIHTLLEGWIEHISLPSINADMWVNESGKLIGLPNNPLATTLWENQYGATDIIVGNAVITGRVDEEGETKGLSEKEVEQILQMVKS